MPLTVSPWQEYPSKTVEEMNDLGEIMADLLTDLADANSYQKDNKNNPFFLVSTPNMSVKDYLHRHVKYLELAEADIMAMLIILDRAHVQKLLITPRSIHLLIATALLIEQKFFNDTPFAQSYYAELAGISRDRMNILEYKLLLKIGFNLFIEPKVYLEYKQMLVNHVRNHVLKWRKVELYWLNVTQEEQRMYQKLQQPVQTYQARDARDLKKDNSFQCAENSMSEEEQRYKHQTRYSPRFLASTPIRDSTSEKRQASSTPYEL